MFKDNTSGKGFTSYFAFKILWYSSNHFRKIQFISVISIARPLLFFCNHFEELKTVLFEVERIINNAPLTYAYPNTIET